MNQPHNLRNKILLLIGSLYPGLSLNISLLKMVTSLLWCQRCITAKGAAKQPASTFLFQKSINITD